FFNDPPTPEISPLSLHDALPILPSLATVPEPADEQERQRGQDDKREDPDRDRKSTRLNSSHTVISYPALCLKKGCRHMGGMRSACKSVWLFPRVRGRGV